MGVEERKRGAEERERHRGSEKGKDNFPHEFFVVDKNIMEKAIQEHGRKTIVIAK